MQSLLVIQALVKINIGRRCSKRVREHFSLVRVHLNDRQIGLSLHSADFCDGIKSST